MSGSVVGLSREYEQTRYSDPHNILRSETIYGEGFQSPGGADGFQETMVDRMSIRDGMRLLDIGSGLGGAVFHLASKFSVEIVGIDTAPNMTDLARSRQSSADRHKNLTFITGDIYSPDLEKTSFDIIYSRDVLMYEPNKRDLFKQCHSLMKAGGHLYVTDFGIGQPTPAFSYYVSVSNYHLHTINDYTLLIEQAGFSILAAEDVSLLARRHLAHDLQRYQDRIAASDPAIRPDDAEHIIERWKRKIRFVDEGSLTQGFFIAVKR